MSSMSDVHDRLRKLRTLREKLCKKDNTWIEAFEARDWIIDQVKTLRNMTESETHTIDDIKARLEDILCALDNTEGGTGG